MIYQELIFKITFKKFPIKFLLTATPVKESPARKKHLSLSIKLYADTDSKSKDEYWMERVLPVPPRYEVISDNNRASALRWTLRQVSEVLHARLRESFQYDGEQFFLPTSDELLKPPR